MKRFIRRLCNSLRYLCGMPLILEPQNCSREQPHDGPCNGWPCASILRKLYEQHKNCDWDRIECTPNGNVRGSSPTSSSQAAEMTTLNTAVRWTLSCHCSGTSSRWACLKRPSFSKKSKSITLEGLVGLMAKGRA